MNKIKMWVFVAAMIGLTGTACYEDKGNYDYQALNNLTINLPLEVSNYVLGDVLKLTPELTFSLGEKTSDLSYSWTFNGQEISTEAVLNWTVNLEGQYKSLRLAVTDEATGVTYYGFNTISVTSPYAPSAWVALSAKEGDGTSMITYMRPTRKDDAYSLVVEKDIYGLMNNGASLGGTPISISQHFVTPWGGQDVTSWLWVNQTGGLGCVDLNGSTYHKEVSLQDIFINKTYPEGFQPHRVYDFQWITMAIGTNGKIYTRVKDNNQLFHNNYIIDDRVLKYKQAPIDGTMLNITPSFAEHGGLLLFDKNTRRYYHVSDYKEQSWQTGDMISYAGNVLLLRAFEEPFDDMSGYTVHYIGAYKKGWAQKMYYKSLVEKDGRFYLQDFDIRDYSGGIDAPTAITYSMADITTEAGNGVTFGSLMGNGRKNCFELCYYQDEDRPYFLFSSGNDLYLYYFNGDEGKRLFKFASFDAQVNAVKTGGGAYEGHAGVGLENGDFYVLDLDRSVVEEVIKNGDSDKKVLFKQPGLGQKIVDVIFKMDRARDSGSWF